jgi:cytochrome c5
MVLDRMGALLFIAGWIVVALVIFAIAVSGGPGQARERLLHSQSRRGRRITGLLIAAVFIGMGIAVPALVIAGNEGDNHAGVARVELNAAERHGRDLFGTRCNQCHTLAAANTSGRVGPNLDQLKPPKALVLDAVENGRARGNGRMPADVVQGRDARDVAAFVAKVAGRQ